MIIDCIADLHGYYPQLEGGDLLIVAGDLTAKDTEKEWDDVWRWLCYQNYKTIITVAGNHDNYLQIYPNFLDEHNCESSPQLYYLCDSGTEFEYFQCLDDFAHDGHTLERKKFKIWGSPWTLRFPGENPHCLAFTCETERELAEKWACIPEDTDILVTHSPIYSLMDETVWGENVGSRLLMDWFLNRKTKNLKLCVCGHIHEAYGQLEHHQVQHVNASHVNERYEPVNKPIRIVL